jgi:hypothetical protein
VDLRLQQYDFKVVYKAGKDNPADLLSRHPLPVNRNKPNIADEYVNFITVAAVPTALTLHDILLRLRKRIRISVP